MEAELETLFNKGDFLLKEAKSKFFLEKEEQCDAPCICCKAVKRYLDAYVQFLFESYDPSKNYHVLLHTITQKDPEFKKFTGKIYQIKCFAEESKNEGVKFFLYPDEIEDSLKIAKDVRNYIAQKIGIDNEQLKSKSNNSYMAI